MKKFLSAILVIILFLSSNSVLYAKRKEQYDEKVVKPTVTTEESSTQIAQEEEVPNDPPSQEVFVKSIADAKSVVQTINKFLDTRIDQIEFYEFLDEDTIATLSEEISDIKTKISRIEDGIDGMEIDTFNIDMPEIQDELTSINSECLALNETQQDLIIEELKQSYLNEHKELHKEIVEIFNEYHDFLQNVSEIEDLIDSTEELIDELSDDFDEENWEELDSQEEDLVDLLNSEATRHRGDQ